MNISLKKIRALKNKKERDAHGLFIVEGAKFVAEIPKEWEVVCYICAEDYAGHVPEGAATVSQKRFASLSDTVTPQGILAVVKKRYFALQTLLENIRSTKTAPFFLLGEKLNDPGNIGTLIRTAAAAGVDAVVLSAESGDVFNPKTLRSAAGAALRVPIIENANLPTVAAALKAQGILVVASHLQGEVAPYELDLRKGCAILVGSEAAGLSAEVTDAADVLVKLPMSGEVESLNASVAGGVIMYEVLRQRSVSGGAFLHCETPRQKSKNNSAEKFI